MVLARLEKAGGNELLAIDYSMPIFDPNNDVTRCVG